ncbi:MAG: hypothetical protein AB7R90_20050 [Reyranellaceae bacterium]
MASSILRLVRGLVPAAALAGATLIGALAASDAQARERPEGDWYRYCKDVDLRGDWLKADCRRSNGKWRNNTRINFDDCPGNRVTVRDGHLVCDRNTAWRGKGDWDRRDWDRRGWDDDRWDRHRGQVWDWNRNQSWDWNRNQGWDHRQADRRDWDRDRNRHDRRDWNGRRDDDRRQVVGKQPPRHDKNQDWTKNRRDDDRREADRRDNRRRDNDRDEWWKRGNS